MQTSPPAGYLQRDGGAAVAIPLRGLVVGRRRDCDVVLQSNRASQVHALLTPTLDGLELLSLGRNPTLLNGQPVQGRVRVPDGATLELPGAAFRVVLTPTDAFSDTVWCVVDPQGHAYTLRRLPFLVGGGKEDHLRIAGWPPSALEFHAAGGALAMEFLADGLLNGTAMPLGTVEGVQEGDVLTFAGHDLRVEPAEENRRETTHIIRQDGALRVEFAFQPTGASLVLDLGEGPREVLLPELRARFVAALLTPPGGYEAGELIPDEVMIPAVWTGQAERSRTDVNVLIYRTRKTLLKAGINPERVLSRARTGGATRFRLAKGATLSVS